MVCLFCWFLFLGFFFDTWSSIEDFFHKYKEIKIYSYNSLKYAMALELILSLLQRAWGISIPK